MQTELAKDDECRLTRFHAIRQMKFINFQDCPTKQAAILPVSVMVTQASSFS